jgi:hypothetical protein
MPRGKLKKSVPPPPPPEEEEILSKDEIDQMVYRTIQYGDIYRLKSFISNLDPDSVYISGSVTRHNSHYVHEKTTSFELEADWRGATKGGEDLTPEEQEMGDTLLNTAQEDIQALIVQINKAIYKSLEKDYEWQNADEQVDENIRANEYEFDEDGNRVVDGPLQFDQLGDDAKKRARDWFREGSAQDDWYESTVDDWKQFLSDMGFDDPEVSFSGFGSQGDGASFISTFDLDKFTAALTNPEMLQRIR